MFKDGSLDKMPTINLIMVNTPTIVNEKAYQLTPEQAKNINSIQINSKADLVAGAGRGMTGSGALVNDFYKDSKYQVNYEDQIPFDWCGCGTSNHCGQTNENAKIWFPSIEKLFKK